MTPSDDTKLGVYEFNEKMCASSEACANSCHEDDFIEGALWKFEKLRPVIHGLMDEIEKLRMQLAGCGVAAMQNTKEAVKERITKDNPYWSSSYGDVCRAVDSEIEFREEIQTLKAEIERLTKGLEFYADKKNWFETFIGTHKTVDVSDCKSGCGGDIAREVLNKQRGGG